MQNRGVDFRDLERGQPEELTEKQAEAVSGGGGMQVAMGDGSVRMTDIPDGTSNTILFSERYAPN